MEKIQVSWILFESLCGQLADLIVMGEGSTPSIYGVPTGGCFVAKELSNLLNISLVEKPDVDTLIVDDIVDSGRTLSRYEKEGFKTAALHVKKNSKFKPYYAVSIDIEDWITYPYENNEKTGEDIVTRFLEYIGENPNRVGLGDTPKRVVKMWDELYIGYDKEQKPDITVFPNGEDGVRCDEMIIDKGYFFSFCEHHTMPFFGQYYFGYIPDKNIIGLSKVSRIVDYYSSKLQVQERLGKDIVEELNIKLKPQGIALILKARHLCKEMRGVKKINGEMITSEMRGNFRTEQKTREEFLNLIKLGEQL